ncbi:MAG: TetR/AcrR family transcriptional regulator [Candidatus Marinimicrobia bacterium]|nr:TetR/AcrR family transcriptional regulator [Candidatus Neomarinimicrobiota bacterium]MCF7827852.1 TetR/AcrR family transcriptional regulator [Candidatus Neomarinimicrobiota bacterium]MCF7879393.1 TetR/AcrR family transcriptional regulator [Candidatus Neomarinimicrobiota bacterium]
MSRKQTNQSNPKLKDRRAEERDQRRQSILDAALTLFAKQGYTETKLTEIAEAARLGKATLYYYFPEKETIYWTIYEEETIRYYERVSDAILSTEDPAEIISLYFRQYINYGYENTDFLKIIFPLGKSSPMGSARHREIGEKVDDHRKPIDEHLNSVLEKNQSPLSGPELTELIWTMLSGLSIKIIRGAQYSAVVLEAQIFIDSLNSIIQGETA